MGYEKISLINVVPSVEQTSDGVGVFVKDASSFFYDRGINVRIATLDWGMKKNTSSYIKFFPPGKRLINLGRSPQMLEWLIQESNCGKINIIHNHGLWMMPNVYAGNSRLKSNCSLIFSTHGALSPRALSISPIKKSLFWMFLQGPSIKRSSCLHATSEGEYSDIRALGIKQPVCILTPAVNVPPLEKKVDSPRKKLLYLARIHPIKGLEDLLRAWRVLQKKFYNWDLVIVGPDSYGYQSQMQNLATDLGVKRCTFRGEIFGQEKLQAFREASLYILPSHSENFGITVAESLAAGTPVIVTNAAPWSSLETNGSGWCIDRGLDSLIYSLEYALSQSPQTLENMGQAGRQWMLRDFSWDRVGTQFLDTYLWMLQGGTTPLWVKLD